MKKLFSSILALAMAMSMFTFTAQAGTEGNYHVTYEAINVASGDVNKLAEGDMIWAVVTLKNAEGLFSGGIGLTWDDSVLQLSNSSGAAKTTFALVTEAASKVTTAATTTGLNMETGEEDNTLKAFEQNSATATASSIEYEYSAANIFNIEADTDGFWDYPLNGDLTILKVRFKVLKAADPKLSFAKARICETTADGGNRDAKGNTVAALGFGSSDDGQYFATSFKWGEKAQNWTGIEFKFTETKADKSTAKLAGKAPKTKFSKADFEADMNVTLGVKVSGAPEGSTLTLDSAEWYK